MNFTSLQALRISLLAAMGLVACNGSVAIPGQASSSGNGGSTAGSTGNGDGNPATTTTTGAGGAITTTATTGTTGPGTTSSTTSTTSSTTATTGVGGAPPTGCPDSQSMVVKTTDAQDSGFRRCPDGTIHRAAKVQCDPKVGVKACTGMENSVLCQTDAECNQAPNGRCSQYTQLNSGSETTECGCQYPCESDAQCSGPSVCVCAGVTPGTPIASCVLAFCKSDAACPSGECGLSSYNDGCGLYTALACRKADDVCRVAADCPLGAQCALAPGFTPSLYWSCAGPGCAIGQPLLVEGRARTAPR